LLNNGQKRIRQAFITFVISKQAILDVALRTFLAYDIKCTLIFIHQIYNTKGVFAMLVRKCAGGLVFNDDKVFLLQNEKGEWVFPKGVIRKGELANEIALKRVREEADISATIISTAGRTNYEFYSVTRKRPVCNKITWYIMEAFDENYNVDKSLGFKDGGFFNIEEAIEKVTYSQDKAMLSVSFKTYNTLVAMKK
jgi:8-oxo-dGTP pyrophosphatase MutT (NUDIX family)